MKTSKTTAQSRPSRLSPILWIGFVVLAVLTTLAKTHVVPGGTPAVALVLFLLIVAPRLPGRFFQSAPKKTSAPNAPNA